MEKFAYKELTKIRRAKHLASHAQLEGTGNTLTMVAISTFPKYGAAPTVPPGNIAVPKASRRKKVAICAQPGEPALRRAWTQARNAHPQKQGNTITEKSVCRGRTKIRRGKPRANLARPGGMEMPQDSKHPPAPVFVHQEPSVSRDSRNARCATKASTAKTRRKTATTARNSRPPWAPARPRACANEICFARKRRHASTARN